MSAPARRLPGIAAAAAVVLLAGCQGGNGPLAARDSFFSSPSSSAALVGLQAGVTIEAHQDLVAIQRACGDTGAAAGPAAEPNVRCRERATRFFGRRADAYRRWVEDQVRDLPEPAQTATAAGQ